MRTPLSARIADYFAVNDPWQRPRPAIERSDWLLTAGMTAMTLTTLELLRNMGSLANSDGPLWAWLLAPLAGCALLLWRRRYPLLIAILGAAHMFLSGMTMPVVMASFGMQVVYFICTMAGVAWARNRRAMVAVIGAIVLFMFGWLAWQFALGSGMAELQRSIGDSGTHGWLSPIQAGVVLTLLINAIFFGGAILGGQALWRAARQRAALVDQADTIAAQSDSLRRRAIAQERLRIARELHDVVGHHVSVIGIQAAAARRVLETAADLSAAAPAGEALTRIEGSSRDAVGQMRQLLGTLRDIESAGSEPTSGGTSAMAPTAESYAPEPSVADLPDLIAERSEAGLAVELETVESVPGAALSLPAPVSLSLYRIVQEALANVVRHSTAQAATVVLRVDQDAGYAEVEILDAGRPRTGTSGTGLGQLGMRERVNALGGAAEIGPRPTGGYRVRVRIPIGEAVVLARPADARDRSAIA